MKKTLVALSAMGLFLIAAVTYAADAEKTITGEGQCAKCSLKKADACQNVIVAKEDGKEVVYYLKGKISDDFHKGNLCTGKKEVKAKGTVKEVSGKHELTAASIELVKH
jgi:hypothetical protein